MDSTLTYLHAYNPHFIIYIANDQEVAFSDQVIIILLQAMERSWQMLVLMMTIVSVCGTGRKKRSWHPLVVIRT